MKTQTMVKGAFLAFCVICMLALPAAAAQDGQVVKARQLQNGQAAVIDDSLKEDLWNHRMEYRLRGFDLNREEDRNLISILQSYGCDTTGMERILSEINSKRPELESALQNRDREALKAVNEELRKLEQQFHEAMRTCIQEKYGTRTMTQAKAANTISDLSKDL